jgi:cathepsin C
LNKTPAANQTVDYAPAPPAFAIFPNQKRNPSLLERLALHEREEETLQDASAFQEELAMTNHQEYVETLNSVQDKTWEATVYPEYQGKTYEEILVMLGMGERLAFDQKMTHSALNPLHAAKASNDMLMPERRTGLARTDPQKSTDPAALPKEFNWLSYAKPARRQKKCGSCYIFSTLAMIEARLRIFYGEDVDLSRQFVLDCSAYNQGCRGGYSYLVGKFALDFELIPETCKPYRAKHDKCQNHCDLKALDKVYKVREYYLVGGPYGSSTEENIMMDLWHNGPIAMSMNVVRDFFYYKSGVYKLPEIPAYVREKKARPEFQKLSHSVLCVGWGEENGMKYWLVQNSWGTKWGDQGFFKIRRGTDDLAIESMPEAAIPVVLPRKSRQNCNTTSLLQSDDLTAAQC